jgi:hypothetical protein
VHGGNESRVAREKQARFFPGSGRVFPEWEEGPLISRIPQIDWDEELGNAADHSKILFLKSE